MIIIFNRLCRFSFPIILFSTATSFSASSYAALCEYNLRHEWNSGFTVDVVVTNNTTQVIDGWTIGIDVPGSTISTIWNASLHANQIENKSYNKQILPT